MGKPISTKQLRDDSARIVAELHGVSQRYVEMVRNGERDNDDILESLVEYRMGKTKLIKHIEKLIPLDRKTKRHASKIN